MSIPSFKPNFSGFPEEKLVRHFRNILILLKKTVQSSKEVELLKAQMEQFINANRKVAWSHHTSGVFHKDEAEKALEKVVTEFQRYIKDLQNKKPQASYQDLLDALLIVESMMDRLKER